jgi:FHA domain
MAQDGKTPKVPLTFRIFRGNDLVRTETLTQSPIKIGKLSSSHLRLEDDESVSRMHAVIEVTSAKDITIIDLGSTKGTIVNGKKINKASLQDGDIILLGDTKIVLSMEEGVDEEPTTVSEAPKAVIPPAPIAAAPPAPPPRPAPPAPPPAKVGAATGPAVIASSPAPAPVAPPPGVRPMAPPVAPPRAAAPPPVASPAPAVTSQAAAAQFSGAQELGSDLAGKRAIEVAAMLSDSVVGVRHLTNPRGGKLSGLTYALFGIGAASLLLSVGIFMKGMSIAADNKALLHDHIEVQKLDPIDFRPIRMGAGMDVLAIIGFLGGIVCVTIGTARMLDEKRSPFFRIGRGREVEFPTADVPGGQESFTLVGPRGDDFVFNWAPGMKGEMTVEGTTTPLEQVAQGNVIPHKARIRVESGQSTFVISSVPAPRAAPTAFNFDSALALFAAISFGFHALMVLLFFLLLDDISGYSSDGLDDDLRGTRVQIKPQEEPKPPEDPNKGKEAAGQTGGTGTAMAGDSGKMGKKDSDRKSGQFAIKKEGDTAPQLAKEQRLEAARSAGALGVIRAQQGGAFANVTGTGDFSSGLDDRDVFGGLQGNEVGEMQGGFGYGVSGTGAGGGGTGLGTIGTGRYGTIGHGSGTGGGYGVKGGGGGLPGRQPSGPKVSIGNATATGDLDKNTIRRYVRQKLAQIEYCYQKQLVVKPTLSGTVNTQFTIDGNGRVIAAKAGGMGNSDVENCVADVLRSIQFPKPTGGGIVNVTSYPFTFRPAGG